MKIKTNSKEIKKGDIFAAVPGINSDGHNYIDDAIENGASYIICEKGEYNVPYMIVPSTKDFIKDYVKKYEKVINDICIIGITGTNGKTTSCYLIYELLKLLNIKCAYIGTLGFYLDEKVRDLNNTTPDILSLYEIIEECKDNGVKVIYKFKYKNKRYKVKINIPGKYNIYNSIIGIIILNNMGISMKMIIKLLNKVTLPSGRMEIININKSYAIVDYAHTPDAVSNVLKNVNEFKKGKVYTIIGCGGNRDKSKRKDMGIISTELSDYVIFTNDNPRSENPDDIILDMTKDLVSNNYEVIKDRGEAIRKGVSMLSKSDILLVLGKGHENYQIINGIKYHFNDKEEVLKSIKT